MYLLQADLKRHEREYNLAQKEIDDLRKQVTWENPFHFIVVYYVSLDSSFSFYIYTLQSFIQTKISVWPFRLWSLLLVSLSPDHLLGLCSICLLFSLEPGLVIGLLTWSNHLMWIPCWQHICLACFFTLDDQMIPIESRGSHINFGGVDINLNH